MNLFYTLHVLYYLIFEMFIFVHIKLLRSESLNRLNIYVYFELILTFFGH